LAGCAQAPAKNFDEDKGKVLVKHALRSESHTVIAAMVALASSENRHPGARRRTRPQSVAAQRTERRGRPTLGRTRPHHREDLLTRLAPVTFDRIMGGNQDLIHFLQRAMGWLTVHVARRWRQR
jgi:hypothetical protein